MSILEAIQTKPRARAIAGTGLIVLASTLILFQFFGRASNARGVNDAFYSDDDGQTWFVDDVRKLSPIDRHGRPAYRAVVCRGADGKPFVARLLKCSDEAKARIEAAENSIEADHWRGAPMDVKRPGESTWHVAGAPPGSKEALAYQSAVGPTGSPDGSGDAAQVFPRDPDNGAVSR